MAEFLLTATPLGAILVLLVSIAAVVSAVALASSISARLLPSRVVSAVDSLHERLDQVESNQERWTTQMAARTEDLEGLNDSIERRRKQLQGVESRARARTAQEEAVPAGDLQPVDQGDRLAAIRAQIYGGNSAAKSPFGGGG